MGESAADLAGDGDPSLTPPNGSPFTMELPCLVERPFRIIAFDWDGTAVVHRREDTAQLRDSVERLLRLDVFLMIISGTKFPTIDQQLSAAISGAHKRNLFISTNRGSEVYGFDGRSRPVLFWQRVASREEDRLLTEIIDAVGEAVVAKTGLEVRVVYDRLNRRKIDLIPLPEWRNPPRSAIGEALQVVEARLKGAGLGRGLREVLELLERAAREKGLRGARLTADAKQVEVGLTDKSDAMDWLIRELARWRSIPPEDVLIAGDEFGPVAGLDGSDYKMVTPQAKRATFVSVGPEPGGAPPEVVHLGGGPACFQTLLAYQAALHERLRRPSGAPASGIGYAPITRGRGISSHRKTSHQRLAG
jgi:hypothetical protein